MLDKMKEEDVNLIVSAGDQVEDQSWGKSSEYAAFFAPEEMTSLLYAPAVGIMIVITCLMIILIFRMK
mgnify:CR=1 FL=1